MRATGWGKQIALGLWGRKPTHPQTSLTDYEVYGTESWLLFPHWQTSPFCLPVCHHMYHPQLSGMPYSGEWGRRWDATLVLWDTSAGRAQFLVIAWHFGLSPVYVIFSHRLWYAITLGRHFKDLQTLLAIFSFRDYSISSSIAVWHSQCNLTSCRQQPWTLDSSCIRTGKWYGRTGKNWVVLALNSMQHLSCSGDLTFGRWHDHKQGPVEHELCKSSEQQDTAQGYNRQSHRSLCTWPDNCSTEIFTFFYICVIVPFGWESRKVLISCYVP